MTQRPNNIILEELAINRKKLEGSMNTRLAKSAWHALSLIDLGIELNLFEREVLNYFRFERHDNIEEECK